MKKQPQVEPDIAGLIIKMQEQITFLEKKIDTLISQSSSRPAEVRLPPKPFQQFMHPQSHGGGRHENNYRERVLHKAICASCKKECEVPFKPSGERPVYCKECFSKRKAGGPFNERPDSGPREVRPAHPAHAAHAAHVEKEHSYQKRKSPGKKRPFPAKRKKRS